MPAVLLPNPQDLVIQQNRQVREEAQRQAERSTRSPRSSTARAPTPTIPRTQLADELRELAERLRDNPGDLDANLAELGSVEDDVRAQLDPSNEQRAASIAALSRSLSRAATGNPQANPDGDPKETSEDLQSWATSSTR